MTTKYLASLWSERKEREKERETETEKGQDKVGSFDET